MGKTRRAILIVAAVVSLLVTATAFADARVLVSPTLVVNEKVVCSGRYPTREEVLAWLQEALED